jgi:hypothetical protein
LINNVAVTPANAADRDVLDDLLAEPDTSSGSDDGDVGTDGAQPGLRVHRLPVEAGVVLVVAVDPQQLEVGGSECGGRQRVAATASIRTIGR